jgi:uncharacterized protein YjbJ (UPF0337 family)
MSSSDYPNPDASQGQRGRVIPAKAEETIRHDVHEVVETAKHEFEKVKDEATSQASGIVDEAKAQIADVTEKAKGLAIEQKELLAGHIGGVAEAMERVAADLEGQNSSSAQYARMIADGAGRISETVQNNDVDAILSMAQDFGRKQPAAFMGAAALLGFAASRFLLASAKREEQRGSDGQTASSVDYNGTPEFKQQAGYDQGASSDYSSRGRV